MRRHFLLLGIILLTVGCNHKPKEQEEQKQEQVKIKVLTESEKREIQIQDSLKQVRTDSLALIAWGDAKFGITMKQALSTETLKNGNKFTSRLTMNYNREEMLSTALGLKNMASFWAIFKQNELIRIWIESYDRPANEIDFLSRDCDIFIKNFKEKYGDPSFIKDKINISDFDDAREIEYAKFQIGTKTITILLTKNSSYYTYSYNIYIDNSQFPKKKPVPTEQENREKEKYQKELKAVKENSF